MTANWDEWLDAIHEKSQAGASNSQKYYDCTLLDSNAEMQQLTAGVADIADAKRLASDGFHISENWKRLRLGSLRKGRYLYPMTSVNGILRLWMSLKMSRY